MADRVARYNRKKRIRKMITSSKDQPRLVVFKSLNSIYAQVIDDTEGKTLASASSLKTKKKGSVSELAKIVGEEVAKKALEKGVKKVVFDRNGYKYHGKVKNLADAAREAGLIF